MVIPPPGPVKITDCTVRLRMLFMLIGCWALPGKMRVSFVEGTAGGAQLAGRLQAWEVPKPVQVNICAARAAEVRWPASTMRRSALVSELTAPKRQEGRIDFIRGVETLRGENGNLTLNLKILWGRSPNRPERRAQNSLQKV